jgi:hypothetical protein
MGLKFLSGAFRGAVPAALMVAGGMAAGAVFGAVKSGQAISKHIQKPKPGDNKASKLLKEVEKKQLLSKNKEPVPVGEMMSFYEINQSDYAAFEKAAKKYGVPYARVDIDQDRCEIMVLKDHDNIIGNIKRNIGEDRVADFEWNRAMEETVARREDRPILYKPAPDPYEEGEKAITAIEPEKSAFKNLLVKVEEVVRDICKKLGFNTGPDLSRKPSKPIKEYETPEQCAHELETGIKAEFTEQKAEVLSQEVADRVSQVQTTEHYKPLTQYRQHPLPEADQNKVNAVMTNLKHAYKTTLADEGGQLTPQSLAEIDQEIMQMCAENGLPGTFRIDNESGATNYILNTADKSRAMDAVDSLSKAFDQKENPDFFQRVRQEVLANSIGIGGVTEMIKTELQGRRGNAKDSPKAIPAQDNTAPDKNRPSGPDKDKPPTVPKLA